MMTQWQCIQQNIGIWQGSFTQFSPAGEQVKDTPSVLTLAETESGVMQLTLERTPEGKPPNVVTQKFSAPGPAPYIYFFETGAFSQGSAQWAAFDQFGAEMSLKVDDRRVRFVVMYASTANGTGKLKYVTLIRETQPGGTSFSEPDLKIEQLIASFKGDVNILHADMSPMMVGHSRWHAETTDSGVVLNSGEYGERDRGFVQELSLSAEQLPERSHAQKVILLQADLTYQLMLLPNGAYCLLPQTIKKATAFRIEVGWFRRDGERSRLTRYYDDRGVWTASALIADRPVA